VPISSAEVVGSGSNLELKARIADLNAARDRVRALGADLQGAEHQVDQYYQVPKGRMKLRRSSLDGSHLIVYLRLNDVSARVSTFHRLPVDRPDDVAETLEAMFDAGSTVDKEREVWWWNDVRIHLDRVVGLGTFVEFEARLDKIGDHGEAQRLIDELTRQLGIESSDLISTSYGEMTCPTTA
jgi:predicted adenylyl cyclase CyaB